MTDKNNNNQKHILIVSQYFYPENFRINDIAKELVNRGYKVTVLTGIPNYPEGKFYKGYGLFKNRRESWGSIEIIRIPIISRGKNKIKLILNYYSFVIFGKLFSTFTRLKADAIFCFGTSPLIQASIAKKLSKKLNIPFYFYVQDLWPDVLSSAGGISNKVVLNHYSKVMKKIYSSATTIFCTSPSIVDVIRQRTNREVIYLPQYSEDCYKPVENKKKLEEIKENSKFKIVFTGNIGAAQGLDILIEAAKSIDDVEFVIIGGGRKKEDFLEKIKGLEDKFTIIDRKPPEMIPYYLRACHAAFLSFSNNEVYEKIIPAKLQSYMACGMPIIASACGECKRIIEEADCGYCSKPGDVGELINNINKIMKDNLRVKGDNALKYSNINFNKNNIIDFLCKKIETKGRD